ncbi:hypothetical protein [Inquilinus sp. CAU 1745]|uniref:hypothetical protein n=1 Tax=Inquilinus sp. CAU 1745 TaxID=3140369 RepID=UPI00325AB12F
MGRRRFTGGEGPDAVPSAIDAAWMLDQVQHDIVFIGHSRLDLESMGRRRFTGGEGPDAVPSAIDTAWMPNQVS